MSRIDRRSMLKVMAATAAGVAGASAGLARVAAASAATGSPSSPTEGHQSGVQRLPALAGTPGLTYQTFGGWDFHPMASTTVFSWSGTGPGTLIGTAGAFMLKSFVPPQGSTLNEVSFFVNRPDTASADDVGFFVGIPSTPSYSFSLIAVPGTGFQRVDVPFTAIPVDTTTQEFTLFMNPHGSTNRLLMGARAGYSLNPGLITFPDPRRVWDGFAQPTAPGVYGPVDATVKVASVGGGPSGVPVGAKAAWCAVMSYDAGVMTIFPDLTTEPLISNWSCGVTGPLSIFYMLVPLSPAGKFKFHAFFTGRRFFDVWGYLV